MSSAVPTTTPAPFLAPACLCLCIAALAALGAAYWQGTWFVDAAGRGAPLDFINVWASGQLVHDGLPATSYDPTAHKQVEVALVGHEFGGSYEWFYPPPYLFVAALIALAPYTIAFPLWLAATLPLYLATMRAIVRDRLGLLVGGAFPAVFANVWVGQNGFLTATLIGATLMFLDQRPRLAGLCLGLLTYKPQFGLLFPLVLIATGRWIVFIAAGFTALALALASWLVFGTATWQAFFVAMPDASNGFLSTGVFGFAKLQSLYALLRILGVPEPIAWLGQITLTIMVAAAVCVLWRTERPYELKAAALALGTLLVTPYLFYYDLVVMAVALAFLLRLMLKTGFAAGEVSALLAMSALLAVFPIMVAPVGFGAALLLAAVLARRAIAPA
jgi:hypothetical protein